MDQQDFMNDKSNFSQYIHFKRSSKSHPRVEASSLMLSRSKSTGRDARMMDVMKAYKEKVVNSDRSDDTVSVASFGSQMSLGSTWSGFSSAAARSLGGGDDNRNVVKQPIIEEDDCLSVYSSRSSLVSNTNSLQSHLSSWKPISEGSGCKRKFSSIADAISDSDDDLDNSLAAKRPRTPVPESYVNKDNERRLLESLKQFLCKIFRSLFKIILLAVLFFSCVLCYTIYKNYQCSSYR